jgi:tetratricopeptide (TPR) repeat protein
VTDTYGFDLGAHTRTITTDSAQAQVWFDRGLNWSYAFSREEAHRCFEKVVEHDPSCAIGYWGLAYSMGPYYNGPWDRMPPPQRADVNQRVHDFIRTAEKLAETASPAERALIHAYINRCPEPANDSLDVFAAWDDAYAAAMVDVAAEFGDDDDVCALTIDALMCRTPWQLWDLENRRPADGASTTEAIALLDMALDRAAEQSRPPHPGLLHLKIHLMEMSPTPEAALAEADVLRRLIPDAAHLVHMPSHLYVLCGLFQESLDSNIEAVVADEKYMRANPEIGIYSIYMLHNIHFQMYSAMFLGQYEPALRAGNQIWETVTADTLRHENPFLVNYLEAFYGMKVHVYIRFGKWQEIIDAPMPPEPELFCVTTALWHYAKGVAYAATGDVESAAEQQRLFGDAFDRVPEERKVFNNESRDMLRVGEAMLAGELEYRRGNFNDAFDHLRHCVKLYDQLNYSEPWVWMQPPRHALGALLLEQGRTAEAASVYRADLGLDDTLVRPSQHPGNVWALHGYLECCQALGRDDEAAEIEAQLAVATANADVDVTSSCFCRLETNCCD